MGEFEICIEIAKNSEEEQEAIKGYTELLKTLEEIELDESVKTQVRDTIAEIISDEMNHQEKLTNLYSMISGIQANKE